MIRWADCDPPEGLCSSNETNISLTVSHKLSSLLSTLVTMEVGPHLKTLNHVYNNYAKLDKSRILISSC